MIHFVPCSGNITNLWMKWPVNKHAPSSSSTTMTPKSIIRGLNDEMIWFETQQRGTSSVPGLPRIDCLAKASHGNAEARSQSNGVEIILIRSSRRQTRSHNNEPLETRRKRKKLVVVVSAPGYKPSGFLSSLLSSWLPFEKWKSCKIWRGWPQVSRTVGSIFIFLGQDEPVEEEWVNTHKARTSMNDRVGSVETWAWTRMGHKLEDGWDGLDWQPLPASDSFSVLLLLKVSIYFVGIMFGYIRKEICTRSSGYFHTANRDSFCLIVVISLLGYPIHVPAVKGS